MTRRRRGASSVVGTSAVRLTGELFGAGGALVTSAITARNLGPGNKGVLATLSYLAVLAAAAGALGLGDAATARRRRTPGPPIRAAVIALLAVSAPITAVTVVAAGAVLFRDRWAEFDGSVLAAALGAAIYAGLSVLIGLADGAGRARLVGISRVLVAIVTVGLTAILVTLLDLAVLGALLATAAGWSAGALVIVAGSRDRWRGWSTPKRYDVGALLRRGLPVQIATVIFVASTRADLLIVQVMLGDASAGAYGVAVTTASVATYPALSLVAAALPRLTSDDMASSATEIARTVRTVGAISLAAAVLLGAATPLAVPLAFGPGFRPAVPPTLILVFASVPAAIQWSLTRVLSVRGKGNWFLASHVISLAAMILGDVVLVPSSGTAGAALAAGVAACGGVAVAVVGLLREVAGIGVADLIPKAADVSVVISALPIHRRRAPRI